MKTVLILTVCLMTAVATCAQTHEVAGIVTDLQGRPIPDVIVRAEQGKRSVAFLGKGDVTLEDGLKRLPGIEVSGTGAIRYQGRPISKFYIEGMDMLGGKYNLATKNIPADYTSQVQVLRHHKAKKIDADEESADVALNIKLAKKAKFKPFGEPVFGVGWRGEKPLYAGGLTGMMFTDDFQTIASAKYSNNGNFGSYDMIDHFGHSSVATLAMSALGKWGGGQPPVGEWQEQHNGYGSLNGILRLDSTRQVRANIDYVLEENENRFASRTTYLADGLGISIDEATSPWTRLHRPQFELKYEDNAARRYLCDNVRVKAQFEEDECHVLSSVGDIATDNQQHREATAFNIANNFNAKVRIGQTKFSFTSDVQWQRSPSVVLTMNDLTERAQSTALLTSHSTSYLWKINEQWRVYIPLIFRADYQMIEVRQRVQGWKVAPAIYPSTEWRSPNRRVYVGMEATLQWLHLHYTQCRFSLLRANPSVAFRYTFSGESELRINSKHTTSAGDILDLLTTPRHTTYRSQAAASGIIGLQQTWATDLNYKFQIPYRYFTIVANAAWNQGKRNTLAAQAVSGTVVENTSLTSDSHFRTANADLSLSKSYIPIHTKLIFKSSGYWGSNESVSQSLFVTTYNYGYTFSGEATYNPFSWMQLTGEGRFSRGYTRRLGRTETLDAVTAIGYLAIYPMQNLELKVNSHFVRQQLRAAKGETNQPNGTSSPVGEVGKGLSSILGATAQYKTKRAVWKLTLHNLLNTRHYSYTTFSATDRYTYDCHLLSRTVLLSCKLHLVKKAKD